MPKALARFRCSEGLGTCATSVLGNYLGVRVVVKMLFAVLLGFKVYRKEYGLTWNRLCAKKTNHLFQKELCDMIISCKRC